MIYQHDLSWPDDGEWVFDSKRPESKVVRCGGTSTFVKAPTRRLKVLFKRSRLSSLQWATVVGRPLVAKAATGRRSYDAGRLVQGENFTMHAPLQLTRPMISKVDGTGNDEQET